MNINIRTRLNKEFFGRHVCTKKLGTKMKKSLDFNQKISLKHSILFKLSHYTQPNENLSNRV